MRPDSPSLDAGRSLRCPGLPEDRRGGPVQTGARDCRRLGRPIADTPLAPPRQLLIHNVDCVTGPRGLFTQSRYIMLSRGVPALPVPPGRRSAESSLPSGVGGKGMARLQQQSRLPISFQGRANSTAMLELSTRHRSDAGRWWIAFPSFPLERASFNSPLFPRLSAKST